MTNLFTGVSPPQRDFSSSFVLMLVRVGDQKVYLTKDECDHYMTWWLQYRECNNEFDWECLTFPPPNFPEKLWRLDFSWSQLNDLYNDCLRMKISNLKYSEGFIKSDTNNVVNFYE